MPQNRPSIPAEIERQVLFEAGHRCAVCGTELPLERAHIIPWSRSQDHSFENLVCFCANCHQRADKEKWSEETFRQYKQSPWVIRARISARGNALTSLHQLPPPPADFTGREAELAELRTAVQSGGVTISGVRGMGGIGKTALALKLAQELTPDYPDAQIYLDLQGVSKHPLSPAQAMGHVIRAFHPDARLPESEADLAGLYRSALHGKRSLLLMDNAAEQAQVEPLLSPAGCLLLVTSRVLFHLPGLHAKDLGKMRHEDARDLLLRITPRIGEEADRIATLCAGLPFALRQAAGALSERPDLTSARYADRLAKEKGRLGLIEAPLSLSYRLLPQELAYRWRVLAIFPTSFDSVAAATIWVVEQDEADALLGDLVRRSLIDGEDDRYRLHDLARIFAGSLPNDQERSLAERRHAVHYRNILAQTNKLFLQGGPSQSIALRLVDREWPNIQAGQAWAADRMKEDREAATLTASYSDVGVYTLNLRLWPQERIGWLEAALEAGRILNDRQLEENAIANLGLAYSDLGEARRAIDLQEQALAIAREIGDQKGEGIAKLNLGRAYAEIGDARRAISLYEQYLTLAQEIGDRRGEGIVTGNLGLAYEDIGETGHAIKLLKQYLVIACEIGDRGEEGKALGHLGRAYARTLGDTQSAIEMFEQYLAIAREIGDRRGERIATGSLGLAYSYLGQTARAIEFYEQSLAVAREIGDRRGEAFCCWNLGHEFQKSGNLERAAELMQVCTDYEREIGHLDAEEDAVRVAAIRIRLKAELDPLFFKSDRES